MFLGVFDHAESEFEGIFKIRGPPWELCPQGIRLKLRLALGLALGLSVPINGELRLRLARGLALGLSGHLWPSGHNYLRVIKWQKIAFGSENTKN